MSESKSTTDALPETDGEGDSDELLLAGGSRVAESVDGALGLGVGLSERLGVADRVTGC